MSEALIIQSRSGPYSVVFHEGLPAGAGDQVTGEPHYLIDANVARLYSARLQFALEHHNALVIEATEENKSLQRTIPIFERLISRSVRRDDTLVAIGGGIVQDITCFIASTLLRGLPWHFFPTTLLAQADSCIGSKSSINLGNTKNVLGTYNPPREVHIHARFLDTLERKDMQSGVGEIIKVHAIEGRSEFDRLATDFAELFTDRRVLSKYVRAALAIKRRFIEADEFDRGIRNIFNYGHSFGHAIESATNYSVPHGIAVTIGMDMANFIAMKRGLVPEVEYERMHPMLRTNYTGYGSSKIPAEKLQAALLKDKKNTKAALRLILPVGPEAEIKPVAIPPDAVFHSQCEEFLGGMSR